MVLETTALTVEDFPTLLEQDSRAAASEPIFKTKRQLLGPREVQQARKAHCRQNFEDETVKTLKVVNTGARETVLAYLQISHVSLYDADLMLDPPCSEEDIPHSEDMNKLTVWMEATCASLCRKTIRDIVSLRDEVVKDENYCRMVQPYISGTGNN